MTKTSDSIRYVSAPSLSKNISSDNSSPSIPRRLALVLDMDECLIHSIFQHDNIYQRYPSYKDSFEISTSEGERAIVNKRPGLDAFLREAAKSFDLYVFTAGLRVYGEPILDALDPKGTIFKDRFYREDCVWRDGFYLKDLRVVREDLSRVVLVDNNLLSFVLQPRNGIPVPNFIDDANDRALESLTRVLNSLVDHDDVRPHLDYLFRVANCLAEHHLATRLNRDLVHS
uniref:Putative nuclear LIM factor interactorinteracting protein hyphal form n=1 Tax=Albugo laibachii Nc14 TaxID=890382 RepID=F0W104_9STRA|nr:putative nuclear LIM factor interactorinteracting protein hyphal form [Albugo laibachii Nc14]|eukprot:CCA14728.1 putative nuclear LIM factor interactorinteracting protein hyphal form [Albugo laibachii Nc14]